MPLNPKRIKKRVLKTRYLSKSRSATAVLGKLVAVWFVWYYRDG